MGCLEEGFLFRLNSLSVLSLSFLVFSQQDFGASETWAKKRGGIMGSLVVLYFIWN